MQCLFFFRYLISRFIYQFKVHHIKMRVTILLFHLMIKLRMYPPADILYEPQMLVSRFFVHLPYACCYSILTVINATYNKPLPIILFPLQDEIFFFGRMFYDCHDSSPFYKR